MTVPHKQAILALCIELTPTHELWAPPTSCAGSRTGGLSVVSSMGSVSLKGFAARERISGASRSISSAWLVLQVPLPLPWRKRGRHVLRCRTAAPRRSSTCVRRLLSMYPDVVVALGTPDASSHDIVINRATLGT